MDYEIFQIIHPSNFDISFSQTIQSQYIQCFVILGADYSFPMDEITSSTNTLVGTIPVTIHGNPNIVTDAKSGGALYLNGVDQWVDLGNHRDKCLGNLEQCLNGFTIALWLKLGTKSAAGNNLFYMSSGGHTKNSHGIAMYRKSNDLGASFRTKIKHWSCSKLMTVSDGVWYHVTLTWKEDDGVKFFLNGCPKEMVQACDTTTQSVTTTASNNFILGSHNTGSIPNALMGECYLDDMMVYEHVMSLQVIWSIFVGGVV